jgi:hypothetical protein
MIYSNFQLPRVLGGARYTTIKTNTFKCKALYVIGLGQELYTAALRSTGNAILPEL